MNRVKLLLVSVVAGFIYGDVYAQGGCETKSAKKDDVAGVHEKQPLMKQEVSAGPNVVPPHALGGEAKFDVVYSNYWYSTPNSSVNTISVFDNREILMALEKKITKKSESQTVIFRSDDLGNSWDSIFGAPTLDFGSVYDIIQVSDSDVVIVYFKLVKDTTDQNGFYKPKYYLGHSGDFCKTWTTRDLEMPLNRLPSRLAALGNEALLLTGDGEHSYFWHSDDYGANWTKNRLKRAMIGSVKIIENNKMYAVFNDSVHFFDSPQSKSWDVMATHHEFYGYNVIYQDSTHIWSAYPKPSGLGNQSKSFIIKKDGNGWGIAVNTVEPEAHIFSRRGLMQNAHYGLDALAFVGPQLVYASTDGGSRWDPFYPADTLGNGTNGVICVKENDKYHLIYALKASSNLVKFTFPTANSIENSPYAGLGMIETHPNPATDWLWVGGVAEGASVAVYATTGRLMHRSTISGGGLSLAGLPRGLYLLQVHQPDGTFLTARVAKE